MDVIASIELVESIKCLWESSQQEVCEYLKKKYEVIQQIKFSIIVCHDELLAWSYRPNYWIGTILSEICEDMEICQNRQPKADTILSASGCRLSFFDADIRSDNLKTLLELIITFVFFFSNKIIILLLLLLYQKTSTVGHYLT